jgi:hypothetical protein
VQLLHVEKAFRDFAILKTWSLMRRKIKNTNFHFKKHFISFEMAICGYIPTSEMVKIFGKIINDVQLLHVEKAFLDFTIFK